MNEMPEFAFASSIWPSISSPSSSLPSYSPRSSVLDLGLQTGYRKIRMSFIFCHFWDRVCICNLYF